MPAPPDSFDRGRSLALDDEAPPDQAIYARRWWIHGVLVLSLVIVMTANSTLNIAIPSLVRDTGA